VKEALLPKKKKKREQSALPSRRRTAGITGVDLTRIDGVDVMVAQTVMTEVGLDMSPWKTEAHFASWLGPDKVLARGARHVLNRTVTALRLGASTLLSQTNLGALKAITAMAHRLARLVYRMLKYVQLYVDKGAEYYERRNRQQQIDFLKEGCLTRPTPHTSAPLKKFMESVITQRYYQLVTGWGLADERKPIRKLWQKFSHLPLNWQKNWRGSRHSHLLNVVLSIT
jgi:hypothetical protein